MKSKLGQAAVMGLLAIAAGIWGSGCASTKEEHVESRESMTVNEPSGAATTPATMSSQDQVVIPLHEEQLQVNKASVNAGQVTIRKTVKTDTVSQPVDLRKENLVIERMAPGSSTYSSTGSSTTSSESSLGAPFEERAVTIQLTDEQPLIQKTTVQSGQVVAKKNVQYERQTISSNIRREDVSIDKQGNPTVGGNVNINEAAGAQPQPKSNE